MAHRTSSSAFHAANLLLKHYVFAVIPADQLHSGAIHGLKAKPEHLGIIIDKTTNAFEVALVRPELKYWQERMTARTASAEQVAGFMRRLIAALEKVPKYVHAEEASKYIASRPGAASYSNVESIRPQEWKAAAIGRPASDAANALLQYYRVAPIIPKPYYDPTHDRAEIGKIIEVSMGLTGALEALPLLRKTLPQLVQGRLPELDIRKALRDIGICLGKMPVFADHEDEVKLLTPA